MAEDKPGAPSLYRVLVDRFQSLEASHEQLRKELDELLQENWKSDDVVKLDAVYGCVPGFFNEGSPYRSILESMGSAVHVSSASSGEIIYWNRSAENLYGWKDYEVLGHRDDEFLIADEFRIHLQKIMEQLDSGQSWSGQFPFKHRSSEVFMAMVTKSPFRKDGEFAGVITVSIDATILNNINPQSRRKIQDRGNIWGINLKKIQWHPPLPQIASMPQITSSVSNLASKLLLRRQGEDICNATVRSRSREDDTDVEKSGTVEEKLNSNFHNDKGTTSRRSSGNDESAFEFAQPSKLTAKVLAKLQMRETGNCRAEDVRFWPNGASDKALGSDEINELNSPRFPYQHTTGSEDKEGKTNSSFAAESASANAYENRFPNTSKENCELISSRDCHDCCAISRPRELSPRLSCQDVNELERSGK